MAKDPIVHAKPQQAIAGIGLFQPVVDAAGDVVGRRGLVEVRIRAERGPAPAHGASILQGLKRIDRPLPDQAPRREPRSGDRGIVAAEEIVEADLCGIALELRPCDRNRAAAPLETMK